MNCSYTDCTLVFTEFHESNRCEDREDVSETPTRNDSLATEVTQVIENIMTVKVALAY